MSLTAGPGLLALVRWSVYAGRAATTFGTKDCRRERGANLAAIPYPPGTDRFPGVVLVHGSGRMTRDQLRQQQAHLVSKGIAVLSYDKRGVGESTGHYDNVGVRTSPIRVRTTRSARPMGR